MTDEDDEDMLRLLQWATAQLESINQSLAVIACELQEREDDDTHSIS